MIETFIHELWRVLLELSPSLLIGLSIAGLIHAYLPAGIIRRGLNRPDVKSAVRASLIGVPLPLCSCGVIPTALGLRQQGASRGATTAFMVSTPQTGVDSVLVSASFLGWPFALFKLAAAFVTGLIAGVLVNRFTRPDQTDAAPDDEPTRDSAPGGLLEALRYALFDLLGAIHLWIIAGVVIAAIIGTAVPAESMSALPLTQGVPGMLVVLAISIPLYVCTTASVPIAAALIAAGMPVGSALVFLMAGPATNVATLGAVYRTLGGRVLGIYLGTVVVMSIALGVAFDFVVQTPATFAHPHSHGASLAAQVSAIFLVALLVLLSVRRLVERWSVARETSSDTADLRLVVEGMSCQHCVANVKGTLESFPTVEQASVKLATGEVEVQGRDLDAAELIGAVQKAGYSARQTE